MYNSFPSSIFHLPPSTFHLRREVDDSTTLEPHPRTSYNAWKSILVCSLTVHVEQLTAITHLVPSTCIHIHTLVRPILTCHIWQMTVVYPESRFLRSPWVLPESVTTQIKRCAQLHYEIYHVFRYLGGTATGDRSRVCVPLTGCAHRVRDREGFR